MIYSTEFCDYRLFLCTPDKTEIGEVIYSSLTYNPRFDSYNELDFNISYYNNDIPQTVNPLFANVKVGYLTRLEIYSSEDASTPLKTEYFSIKSPNVEGEVDTEKSVECISLAYTVFGGRILREYGTEELAQTKYLYDDVGSSGIINDMLSYMNNSWTVNYIDTSLKNITHDYTFDKSTYADVFKQLEKDFNCFITFDTENNYINIYDAETYGTNIGLVLSDENFAIKISKDESSDRIATRLYVYGKDGTTIASYNPTGQLYVEDFDYFYDNGYFSTPLASSYATYKALITSETGNFTTLLGQLTTLQSELSTLQEELYDLQTEQYIIEDTLDVYKNTYRISNSAYTTVYGQLTAKEAEVGAKELEITGKEAEITAKQTEITDLGTSLSWSANFTSAEIEELNLFVYEDTLEMKSVSNSSQLYDYAIAYLALKSVPPLSISVDSIDLFSNPELKDYWANISVGDFLNIDCSRLGINDLEMRLISYQHDVLDKNLTFNFSNTNELNTALTNLNKIFSETAQASATLDVKRGDFAQYKADIESILTEGIEIDANSNNIVAGSNYINRRGFMGTDVGSYGEMQLLKDKIVFSQDNWATFYTLLSAQGLYMQSNNALDATPTGTEPISRVVLTPEYGFQIDQWSAILNDWANVVYIGIDGQFHIDNGYLEMLKYHEATPTIATNKILIDPSVGFKISKNTETVEPATPTWTDVLYINTDGDIQLADENGNGIIIDQFGMDTKFIKWFKNMCYNSGFEVYDSVTLAPTYWTGSDGTVITSADSSFFDTRSLKLPVGTSCVQSGSGIINPQFYNNVSTDTRVSFHKKFGKVKVEVLDGDDADNPITLTDEDGNTGAYLEYDYNANWIPESYSLKLTHGSTTQIKLRFTNTDTTYDAYIDAVIIEPDYTGRRPSFYTAGPNSISASILADLNDYVVTPTNIYVQATEPSTPVDNDLWIDTDDYSRYDVGTTATPTTLYMADEEVVVATVGGITLTLEYPSQNGVVRHIINQSSGIVTLSGDLGTLSSLNLFPTESVYLVSGGGEWNIM